MTLTLKPIPDDHVQAFFDLLNDQSLAVHTGSVPHPITLEWAQQRLADKRAKEAEGQAVDRGLYLDDVLVGNAGWFRDEGQVEIAYAIHRDHRGRGLATRAGKLVLEMLEKDGFSEPIYATYFSDNEGSGRVLEKLGFRRIGTQMGTGAARVGEHAQYRMLWGGWPD